MNGWAYGDKDPSAHDASISLQRNVKRQFAPDVEAALNKPSETMWDAVLKSFREALEKAESSYMKKARSELCLLT